MEISDSMKTNIFLIDIILIIIFVICLLFYLTSVGILTIPDSVKSEPNEVHQNNPNLVNATGKLISFSLKNYYGWSTLTEDLELEIKLEMPIGSVYAYSANIINDTIINTFVFEQKSNGVNWGKTMQTYINKNILITFKLDTIFDGGDFNQIYFVEENEER